MATFKQYQKKDGSKAWQFHAYLGLDDVTGREIRTTRRGFPSKKKARQTLNNLLVDFEANGLKKSKETLFSEVYAIWFSNYKNTVKESTSMATERHFDNHILPKFGKLRLEKVSVKFCQKAVNEWANNFSVYQSFVRYTSKVFEYAVHLDIIPNNPFSRVIKPTRTAKKKEDVIKFYTKEQLLVFLTHLESKVGLASNLSLIQHYYAEFDLSLFRLLAFSGLRVGEALALDWSDINFEKHTLAISKTLSQTKNGYVVSTPKTKQSKRTISLDAKTLLSLKKWHLVQRRLLLQNGINSKLAVFTTLRNTFMTRNDVYQRSSRIADACNLHRIGCHGFRHTHASLLFESGANFKEVQERLGHTDIAMTMNIYTHVTDKVKEETAKKFANYVNF